MTTARSLLRDLSCLRSRVKAFTLIELLVVLTIIGLQFSFLLAGSIIIEQVFYLPGLGRLVFQSISARDLIVVESVVMLLVFSVIVVNFLVDLAYAAVDPRLRSRT